MCGFIATFIYTCQNSEHNMVHFHPLFSLEIAFRVTHLLFVFSMVPETFHISVALLLSSLCLSHWDLDIAFQLLNVC